VAAPYGGQIKVSANIVDPTCVNRHD